jgi:hypothetical protein
MDRSKHELESVMGGLYLGIAVTGVEALIAMGLVIVFMSAVARILSELRLAEICADRIKPRDFEGSAPNQRRLAIIFRWGGVVRFRPPLHGR